MTRLLEASGLTVRFGGLVAVNAVDFHVEKDEIVGLIGPNGAGKTTFFNAISGFRYPDEGAISFEGANILGLKPHKISRMGMSRTFQIVKPFPEMSVLDNVMMGAFSVHRAAKDARAAAMQALELVKFSRWAHRLAGELPVAGRKRLEVAKVMACNPKLILLDEVMAGLTPSEAQRDDRGGAQHPRVGCDCGDHRARDAGDHESLRSHLCAASRRTHLRRAAGQGHSRSGRGARLSRGRVRTMTAILDIRSLTAGYDGVSVVRDIDLSVEEGGIATIVGANGAGKTTTLRALSGVLRPVQGEIIFAGEPIQNLPPHEIVARGLVMVPEGRRLFPSLTVMENLELGAFQPHCKRKRGDSLERVFNLFPRLRERETPEGRHAVGRRAADGRHRARAHEPAEGADARRAVARARAGDRAHAV